MTRYDQFDFEATAQQIFDVFLLKAPSIPVEGLFRHEAQFTIVAKNLETIAEDNLSVNDWFLQRLKPLGYPIALSSTVPNGAAEVEARGFGQIVLGTGVLRSALEFRRDLALFLPPQFPLVNVDEVDSELVVYVARALSEAERDTLHSTIEKLGTPLSHRVNVTDVLAPSANPAWLALPSVRFLPNQRKRIRDFLAEDEDFWRTNYSSIFTGRLKKSDVIKRDFTSGDVCLVGSTFLPQNLRTYLSLYQHVVLEFPLLNNVAETLGALGIQRKELIDLAASGNISFVTPRGMDRYDAALLDEVLEANPSSVLASRRLAAACHLDQLARNPLLVLPGTAFERRAVLRALRRVSGSESLLTSALASGLAKAWPSYEHDMHVRGAMVSFSGPLARSATELALAITGNDYFLELASVAQCIEWSSAIGAHYAPFEDNEYSEVAHAKFLLALHSGIGKDGVGHPAEFDAAQELLVVDNQVNIFEFVGELGKGDLSRFRGLLRKFRRPELTDDERRGIIDEYNKQVRSYERRPDRLKSMNLVGAALMLVARAAKMPELLQISAVLLPMLMTLVHEDGVKAFASLGQTIDSLNALLSNVPKEAVLLARMRKQVKGMK